MDAYRGGLINAANKVSVYLVRHKRDHRSGNLGNGYKSRIKRHISIDFVLLHAGRPEAFAASADIPV